VKNPGDQVDCKKEKRWKREGDIMAGIFERKCIKVIGVQETKGV
jgi:hypothetical protein